MEREQKKGPGNIFDDDDLDDAVAAADDTGLVRAQHEIAEEDILKTEEDLQENAGE